MPNEKKNSDDKGSIRMKKYIQKAILLCGYLFLIAIISDFRLKELFDWKEIFLVIAGSILLTIPYMLEEEHRKALFEIAGNNSMISSYLVVFVQILGKSGQIQIGDAMMQAILLSLRPILYGFVIMVLLKRPEMVQTNKSLPGNTRTENMNPEKERSVFDTTDLTEREKEIVRLVLAGLSNREIGEQLYIAESTVKKHMSHIFEKLEVKNREQIKHKFK